MIGKLGVGVTNYGFCIDFRIEYKYGVNPF